MPEPILVMKSFVSMPQDSKLILNGVGSGASVYNFDSKALVG